MNHRTRTVRPSSRPDSAGVSGPGARRRGWSVLVLLSVAQFMVILDMTIVNVALPSMGRSLHFGPGGLQWVVTTAHEVGAALGVAVFASVAAGAHHAATVTGLAAGYQRGYLVAAAVDAGFAVIALLAVPAARPAAGQRVAVH